MGEVRDLVSRANRRQSIAVRQQLKALGGYLTAIGALATRSGYWAGGKLVAFWRRLEWLKARESVVAAWLRCVRQLGVFGRWLADHWNAAASALRPHRSKILTAALVVSIATVVLGTLAIAYLLHAVWQVSVGARVTATILLVSVVASGISFVFWRQLVELASKAWLVVKFRTLKLSTNPKSSYDGGRALIDAITGAYRQILEFGRRALARVKELAAAIRLWPWKSKWNAGAAADSTNSPVLTKVRTLSRREASSSNAIQDEFGLRSSGDRLVVASQKVRDANVLEASATDFANEDAARSAERSEEGKSFKLIEVSLISVFELSFCVISIALLSVFSVVSISGGSLSLFPEVGAPDQSSRGSGGDGEGSSIPDVTSQRIDGVASVSDDVGTDVGLGPDETPVPDAASTETATGIFGLITTPAYWRLNSAFEIQTERGIPLDIDEVHLDHARLCRASMVVAVGISSTDGPSLWNFDRAQRRARSIAQVASTALKACGADIPVVLSVRGEGFVPLNRQEGRRVVLFGIAGSEEVSSSVAVDVLVDAALRRELQGRMSREAELISEQCLFLAAGMSRSPPAVNEMASCRPLDAPF